ncbi:Os11g0457000 [Oryza sativa Japonica Group]|uniref:Os11g0457000 protein n=1 Tax=Oryza sativa subsp. japonica TaxID=39947 RepID=Q0ISV1_ORYSJ|nr:Os11g0457000 [Oryza sativa Japonica Group]|eukprot:NP_001067851.2 Os11g0457000 [Oryza sativa Japonica Group]
MAGVDATAAGGDEAGETLHVVLFPFLAFGHINPFAQLARSLLAVGGGTESTAEVDADGAELLKLALDGTRPQVEALLARLRPDVVLFDFVTPWVADAARRLGVRSARFSIFPAVSGAYFMAHGRGLYGARPTAEELASAPEGFPPSSPLSTVPTYQAAHFTHIFTSFHGMPSTHDRSVACHNACDALVIRTCHEMEGPYIDYIAAQYGKPVLATGPLVPEPPRGELEERIICMAKSIVFGHGTHMVFVIVNDADAMDQVLQVNGDHNHNAFPFNLNFDADEEDLQIHPDMQEYGVYAGDVEVVFEQEELDDSEVMKANGGNGYEIPHMGKERLERLDILPNTLSCGFELYNKLLKYVIWEVYHGFIFWAVFRLYI